MGPKELSLVSIIIPYYNRPQKILRCVNSVLDQSYQNFEILIVDDHSPVPLKSFTDDRIKIFRNEKNSGPGLSRNLGLDHAEGDYIAFLDCDDYWHKDFLGYSVDLLSMHDNLAMVYSLAFNVNGQGEILDIKRKTNVGITKIIPDIYQKGRPWCTSSILWNGDLVKKFGLWIDSNSWEDYVFDTSIAVRRNSIKMLNKPLVYYDTSGDDKLSLAKKTVSLTNKLKSIKKILYIITKHADESIKKQTLSNFKIRLLGLVTQTTYVKNKNLTIKYLRLLREYNMISPLEFVFFKYLKIEVTHYLLAQKNKKFKQSLNKK